MNKQVVSEWKYKMTEVIYKMRTRVPSSEGTTVIHRKIIGTLLHFIEKNMKVPLPVCAWKTNSFHCEADGNIIDCVCIPKRHLWALRFVRNGSAVWNFGLIERRGALEFGMEAARARVGDANHREILKSLSGVINLRSEVPFGGECLIPANEEQCKRLWSIINAQERTYPIIFVSEIQQTNQSWSPYNLRYMVKPTALAARLYGSAGVVVLDYQTARVWKEIVGKEWAVYDGAVRTFFPFKTLSVSPSEHPIVFKDVIREFNDGIRPGYHNFYDFIESGIARFVNQRFVNWDGLFFFESATILLEECTRISGRSRGRPKKEKQDETLLEERLKASQNELSKLRHRLKIKIVDEPLPPPEKKKSFSDKRDCASPQADAFADIIRWVQNTLSDKVFLHPRAERGLLKAQYRSPELVKQAIMLLANDY